MRKICIETDAYFPSNTLDGEIVAAGFRAMKAHGYEAADYEHLVVTTNPLFSLSDDDFERVMKEHRAAAEAAGVEIYQTHGPWRHPPKDATEEDRAERLEKMTKSLYATKLLGSRHMVIHPIMPFGTGAEPDHAAFHDLNFAFYSKLLEEAKKLDVVICLENMPFTAHSIASPSSVYQFIREFNDEHLRMCLDTGHGLIFGVQPADAVAEAGAVIEALHVHDNDGRSDQHRLPFFGHGGICDWDAFAEAVKEKLPESVPMSLEVSFSGKMPPEACECFQCGAAKLAGYLCR